LRLLAAAKGDDEVRIQMFYLSDIDVVDAIADAAGRVNKPLRLILDPSKDAFGKIKDGTPNRQVAAYLMDKKKKGDLALEIRWYETHGEQNHAKIMSIINEKTDKHEVITGSANWTGKNLKDINMESNVSLKGAKGICDKFNGLFDRFWTNSDGMVYTVEYEGKYQKHTGMSKWLDGERWGYVSW
jgi:phosphatidylserine/phosphatidylglycerophosphate/cardiolipin synthase-like enzyme